MLAVLVARAPAGVDEVRARNPDVTTDELRQLLLLAGLDCKVQGDEVLVNPCTFCGNEKANLELNAVKGVYHSWCCNARGRLDHFLAQLTGQAYTIPIQLGARGADRPPPAGAAPFRSRPVALVPSALHYLARRDISLDVATAYGFAVCVEEGHQLYGRLVIPARDFWTGALLGWVGRSYTNGRPKYLSTLPRQQIVGWQVRARSAPCVLVEGLLDGVAAHQAGYHAAVLLGTSNQAVEDFAALLPADAPLVVLLDGDALVRATSLCWQLRAVRGAAVTVQAVLPPDSDPASLGPTGVAETVAVALRDGGLPRYFS